jgi:predicted AAA+ superfamily ATPase
MIIIHTVTAPPRPRVLTGTVERLLQTMPVVVVTGARQTEKSTLARDLLAERRTYLSLDDLDVREQAFRAPMDLVQRSERLVLDEIQRAPELLLSVKRAVDEDRRPGRFVLTGSANLLLMQRVSESLAGRASYVTLWPLTRAEVLGLGRAGRWGELFETPERDWPALFSSGGAAGAEDWRELAQRGGYPVPALASKTVEDRAIWFDGYVRTYLERDLQNLSSIDNLIDFRRLMAAASLRIGQLVNQTELGRDVQLPQPTVRRWLNLLETSYQLVRIPAFSINRTKRLIKTPKAYWCDTGLALHLAGSAAPDGPQLENLVLSDLLAWRDAELLQRPELFYWRTATGEEVDFVIESQGELVAIEVKATSRPRTADTMHLRAFRDEYGAAVRGCLLLHAGGQVERLAPGIVSLPWYRVL